MGGHGSKTHQPPVEDHSDMYGMNRKQSQNQSILNSVIRNRSKNKENGSFSKNRRDSAHMEQENEHDTENERTASPTKDSKKRRRSSHKADLQNEKVQPTVQSVKSNAVQSNQGEGNSAIKARTSMSINNTNTTNPAPVANGGQANMYPTNMLYPNPLYPQQAGAQPGNPNHMNLNAQQGSIPRQRGAPNTFAMSAPQGAGPQPHTSPPLGPPVNANGQGKVPRQRGASVGPGGAPSGNYAQQQGNVPFQPIRGADGAAQHPQQKPQQHQQQSFQPMYQQPPMQNGNNPQWTANNKNSNQGNYNPHVNQSMASTAAPPPTRAPRVATAPPPKPAESILNKSTSFKVAKRKSTTDVVKSPNDEGEGEKKPKKMKLKGWFKRNQAPNVAEEDEEEEAPPPQLLSVGNPSTNLSYDSATRNNLYEYDALSVRSDDQYSNGGMLDSFIQAKSGPSVSGPYSVNNSGGTVQDTSTVQADLLTNMSKADSMFSFKGLDVQDSSAEPKVSHLYGNTAQRENQLALERALAQMDGKGSPKKNSKTTRGGSATGRQAAAEGSIGSSNAAQVET